MSNPIDKARGQNGVVSDNVLLYDAAFVGDVTDRVAKDHSSSKDPQFSCDSFDIPGTSQRSTDSCDDLMDFSTISSPRLRDFDFDAEFASVDFCNVLPTLFDSNTTSTTTTSRSFKNRGSKQIGKLMQSQQYQCSDCGSYFKGRIFNLKRHEKSCKAKLQKRKEVSCLVCGKQFDFVSRLKRHMLSHSQVRSFKCSQCDASFMQSSALKRHEVTHQALEQRIKPYVCPEINCLLSFGTRWEFVRHYEGKHTLNEFFCCDECHVFFGTAQNYKGHREWHMGDRSHYCTVCAQAFKQKCDLDNHKALHDKPGGRFECVKCNERFIQRSQLERHISKWHTCSSPTTGNNGRLFTCAQCSQHFVLKSQFLGHLKVVHSHKRAEICKYCCKWFQNRSVYDAHLSSEHFRKLNCTGSLEELQESSDDNDTCDDIEGT